MYADVADAARVLRTADPPLSPEDRLDVLRFLVSARSLWEAVTLHGQEKKEIPARAVTQSPNHPLMIFIRSYILSGIPHTHTVSLPERCQRVMSGGLQEIRSRERQECSLRLRIQNGVFLCTK